MALTKEDLQAIGALIDSKLEPIKADQAVIRKSQLKVELEQYPRITAALDGVQAGIDKNRAQDSQIYILEDKVENHDDRIIALELTAKAK